MITKPKELDSDEEAIQAMVLLHFTVLTRGITRLFQAKHPEFFFDSDEVCSYLTYNSALPLIVRCAGCYPGLGSQGQGEIQGSSARL